MNPNATKSITIWLIKDQKAGHISQLEGLAERLCAHHNIQAHWLDEADLPFEWRHGLVKNAPSLDIPPPDIIIGAGHQTHKPLIIAARLYQAFNVVLMKPSLPLNWFNAVICPRHDGLREDQRVLNTFGALNKINPSDNNTKNAHLMLIGGPSKHFDWNDENVIEQIKTICHANKEVKWALSDSPRTPLSFLPKLEKVTIPNLKLHPYSSNQQGWLSQQLLASEVSWVTPDSVSMIYESITAGAKTALFDPEPSTKKKPTRVARSIQQLISDHYVTPFEQWRESQNYQSLPEKIWETDRAAKWLLEKFTTETNHDS